MRTLFFSGSTDGRTLLPSHSSSSSPSQQIARFPLSFFLSEFLVLSALTVLFHMERNSRRNYHPFLSSYEPQDRCVTELTLTDSASPAISMDAYTDISRHCAAQFPLDDLTRWTDWQHNLYLNSLEASFVNEMYHSIHLRGCQGVQNNLNEVDKSRTSQKPCNMSGQFLILQDGFSEEVSHERNEPMLESTGDSHVLAGSPLKFTSVERGCAMRDFVVHHGGLLCDESHGRGKSIFSGRSPRSSAEHEPCCPESAATIAEVTDQNFKDEDQGVPSSCVPMDKRLKTATAEDASSYDHVVPIEKFYSTELSSGNRSSSENRRQDELLSELPDSFHLPKSDMLYILKGG